MLLRIYTHQYAKVEDMTLCCELGLGFSLERHILVLVDKSIIVRIRCLKFTRLGIMHFQEVPRPLHKAQRTVVVAVDFEERFTTIIIIAGATCAAKSEGSGKEDYSHGGCHRSSVLEHERIVPILHRDKQTLLVPTQDRINRCSHTTPRLLTESGQSLRKISLFQDVIYNMFVPLPTNDKTLRNKRE